MVNEIKVVIPRENSLHSSKCAHIAPNAFLEERIIRDNEDCSLPFRVKVYILLNQCTSPEIILRINNELLVSSMSIPYVLTDSLIEKVYSQLKRLPNDSYEIWPSSHEAKLGSHLVDPTGDVTELLAAIEHEIAIVKPLLNHNKVSSRKRDKFSLNEMHVDSFEGMRLNKDGKRIKVWRYFMNLGDTPRTTALAILNPLSVDSLIPVEFKNKQLDELKYRPNLLDDLVIAAGMELPYLIITTPPKDKEKKRIYGVKICTTHMLHGEYGLKDDFVAFINSLA